MSKFNHTNHLKDENKMTFCRSVCPWAIKQSKQWSTWRGLLLGIASVTAIVNPILGVAVAKTVGVIIGSVEVAKDDSSNSSN